MVIFIKSTRNGGDSYSRHEGMDLSTVQSLLQDLGCTAIIVIDEDTYISNTRD